MRYPIGIHGAPAATRKVRSLSVPENLRELAQEIQALEERVAGNQTIINNNKLERSASSFFPEEVDIFQELLFEQDHDKQCTWTSSAATNENDRSNNLQLSDWVTISEEDEGGKSNNKPKRRSFFPSYNDYASREEEETEDCTEDWSMRSVSEEADDEDDEDPHHHYQHHCNNDQSMVHTKLQDRNPSPVINPAPDDKYHDVRAAAACVDELLSVIGGSSSETSSLLSLEAGENAQQPSTAPYAMMKEEYSRAGGTEDKGTGSSTTTSQFRHRDSLSLMHQQHPPSLNDADNDVINNASSPTPSPPRFSKLTYSDRANSMPSRVVMPIPKKPSLKRVSSICGRSSAAGGGGGGKNLKRNVSFSKLEIREYSISISDHPSCSYGPPIQLGWEYRRLKAVELEEYEKKRSPRRNHCDLVLSYNVRRYLLMKRAGYTKEEIQQAMGEVDRVKWERLVTDMTLPASKIDEVVEEIVDHVRGMFFPRRHNQ